MRIRAGFALKSVQTCFGQSSESMSCFAAFHLLFVTKNYGTLFGALFWQQIQCLGPPLDGTWSDIPNMNDVTVKVFP